MSESNDEKVMGRKVFLLEAVMYKRKVSSEILNSAVQAYISDSID